MTSKCKGIFFDESETLIQSRHEEAFSSLCLVPIEQRYGVALGNLTGPNHFFLKNPDTQKWQDHACSNFASAQDRTFGLAWGHLFGNAQKVFYIANSNEEMGYKTQKDHLLLWIDEESTFRPLDTHLELSQFACQNVVPLDLEGRGQQGFLVMSPGGESAFFYYSQTHQTVKNLSSVLGFDQFPSLSNLSYGLFSQSPTPQMLFKTDMSYLQPHQFSHDASPSFLTHPGFIKPTLVFEGLGAMIPFGDTHESGCSFFLLEQGKIQILCQKGKGHLIDCTPPFLHILNDVIQIASGDIDNDGFEEFLIFRHNGDNFILRYLGYLNWEEVEMKQPLLRHSAVQACVLGDFSNQGVLDLCILHGNGPYQNCQIFYNTLKNEYFWLKIRLINQKGAAIQGAKIRLTTYFSNQTTRTQTRFTQPLGLMRTHQIPEVHFGLGASPTKVDLEIHWPSGIWGDSSHAYVQRVSNITEFNRSLVYVSPHY